MSGRWLVRVFASNGASVHSGAFGDLERASKRAGAIARRAKRRGMNVSVTVRELRAGDGSIDELLDEVVVRQPAGFHVASYAGVNERVGDEVEAADVAGAVLARGRGRVALLPGETR